MSVDRAASYSQGLKIHSASVDGPRNARKLFLALNGAAVRRAGLIDGYMIGGMRTPDIEETSFHVLAAANVADTALNRDLADVIAQSGAQGPLLSNRELLDRFMREVNRGGNLIPVDLRPVIIFGKVWLWTMHGAIPNSFHQVDPETVKPGDVSGSASGKFSEHRVFLHPDSPYLN
jgi:hypothetical protein